MGATLEVDLAIPEECHDALARLPPAPLKRKLESSDTTIRECGAVLVLVALFWGPFLAAKRSNNG